jgi:hypothetical protein
MASIQARRGLVPGMTAWWSAQNPLNTISGGTNVTTYADLSGNARDLTQGTAGKRPTYGTNAGDTFDGVDDTSTGTTWGAVISNAAHTIYAAIVPLAWSTTSGTGSPHLNHGIFGDAGAYHGVYMRASAGSEIMVWGGSSGYKALTLPASLNMPIVICSRHSGGTLYGSINGGAETSVTCGTYDAGFETYPVRLGQGFSIYANMRFYEAAIYNTSHSAAEIAYNVNTMRRRWGF